MDFRESLYRMSLAGALGGLISWAAEPWVFAVLGLGTVQQEQYWIVSYIDLFLIALIISACCIGFGDYWSNRPVRVYRLAAGAIASCLVVLLMERLLQWVRQQWIGEVHPLIGWMLVWAVTGASIGLVIGVLKYRLILRRILLSVFGGAFGAALGAGVAFTLGEMLPYLTHALGLMITGSGVAFGSTAAVILFRKAQLRFTTSDDVNVTAYFAGRNQVWELHRGDDYLLGKATHPTHVKQYIYVPDDEMAPLHAEVYEDAGNFYLRAHKTNRGPSGSNYPDYPLTVKRSGEIDETEVTDATKLGTKAEIEMGRTRFLFSLRGADGMQSLILIGLLWLSLATHAHAQTPAPHREVRFALADKIRLYQCTSGSERPCFRVTVNLVDRNNDVVPIPLLNSQVAVQQTKVFEGGSELRVVCVNQGLPEEKPRRIAILLVDVSGSMLDSTVPGLTRDEAVAARKTKFDALKTAALRFAEDFEEGVDEIAVIQFASRNVVRKVNEAGFCRQKRCLEEKINQLAYPEPTANTGLYTAVRAAISRMQSLRTKAIEEGSPNPQTLLVVMTDGMNSVGDKNDDTDLLKDWQPVKDLADTAGLPVITVGFGESKRIDEDALKHLAWPSWENYLPARDNNGLVNAFQKARALQLQRMQITFLPQQTLRGQLVKPHEYQVRFRLDQKSMIDGTFSWSPEFVVPPFEGSLSSLKECALPTDAGTMTNWSLPYFGTVFTLGLLLYVLWFKVPLLIWADQQDLQILRSRALSIRGRDDGKD